MRIVLQRVKQSEVRVDGRRVGAIERGYLIFLGIGLNDEAEDAEWLIQKLIKSRLFEIEEGDDRELLSIKEVGGAFLVISQFTLFAKMSKGTRPSYSRAMPSAEAKILYERFCSRLRECSEQPVATGVFGADMEISAIHNGPVTLILDSQSRDL